jgi:two-component sensor histidine kinase
VLAPHTLVGSLGWTAVAVAVPTLLRLALDAGRHGAPFVAYYPAIMIAGLFLGWRFGVLTTVLCAVATRMFFDLDLPALVATPEGPGILALFVFACVLLIAISEWLRRVLIELNAASAREVMLNQELRHRLKNLLSVVNALSSLSHRHGNPEQAHAAFSERLAALDRATGLLGADSTVSCALPDLAEEALRPFLADYDIRLLGPREEIDRDGCVAAVLALHELATNAIKYGSLSVAGGWVDLGWSEAAGGKVKMHWKEKGGPPVHQPERLGMGSRILSMHSLAAEFSLEYASDGVRCEMALMRG